MKRDLLIRELDAANIRSVYKKELLADFPPDEVRPLWQILWKKRQGRYECFGFYEGGTLLGYAFAVNSGGQYLLDYFAVLRGHRGRGLGSEFLRLLKERLSDAAILLAEVEDPDCADDPDERGKRQRRMDFYLRNGFADTSVRALTFGVDYALIALSGRQSYSDAQIRTIYFEQYLAMMKKVICLREVKLK